MTKPADRLLAMQHMDQCYPTPHPLCVEIKQLLDECERALEAYKAAWDSLFSQCLSNGMTNAWGVPVDHTLVNEAQRGEAALAKLRGEA